MKLVYSCGPQCGEIGYCPPCTETLLLWRGIPLLAAVGAHPPQREEFSLFSGGWRREEVLRDCSSSPSSIVVKL